MALAWALLDLPRRPGAVRPLGWYPACSPSPVTLWAVCGMLVCGESGTKGFQRVAVRASSRQRDCTVPEHWPSPHRDSAGKEEDPHFLSCPPSALTSV